ncbi:MAG: hypothetical protein RL015_1280 [Verrucomicrobiota bacterium]|jgi:hypothetical protein
MKKSLLLFICVVFSFQTALADWTITQKNTTDGKAENMVIKVKGDKTRADVGDQMSVISDAAAGEVTMFMHAQKMMMKMNGDSMKGIMALAGQMLGKNSVPSKPVATGQMEKVGEYETEIYTWSGQLGSGKFWVAKDFPGFAELNAVQDKLMKAMGNPAASFAPQNSDFPGMVVKSEMNVMGKSVLSELVSVAKDPVDEAIFKAPEGYQEMKMPTLPGQ